MPRVSVCIPAYNQCGYLREALASALGQTMGDLEVIVVDDGSTDGTRAVCESFADPRLRYVHQANDGTKGMGARNHAMLLARGDWIALLDQDDLWHPDKLAQQLALADARPECGTIVTRVRFIDSLGQVTGEQASPLPDGDVLPLLLARNRYHACSGMFRRKLLALTGLPGESSGLGDWVLWASLARHAPFAAHDGLLADYRIHAAGYQATLRTVDRFRNCSDHLSTLWALVPRARKDDPACAAGLRRLRREIAHEHLRTVRHSLKEGEFHWICVQTLGHAIGAAPGWVLLPWVLLQQTLALLAAVLQGLPKALNHQK